MGHSPRPSFFAHVALFVVFLSLLSLVLLFSSLAVITRNAEEARLHGSSAVEKFKMRSGLIWRELHDKGTRIVRRRQAGYDFGAEEASEPAHFHQCSTCSHLQCPMGPPGPPGEPGPDGEQGRVGSIGSAGGSGVDIDHQPMADLPCRLCPGGRQGERGTEGERGLQGQGGVRGIQGQSGLGGTEGEVGPAGPSGKKGPKGEEGLRGEEGDTVIAGPGVKGPPGPRGSAGPTGEPGLPGRPSPVHGDVGAVGVVGKEGLRGEPGVEGPRGSKGERGQGPPPSLCTCPRIIEARRRATTPPTTSPHPTLIPSTTQTTQTSTTTSVSSTPPSTTTVKGLGEESPHIIFPLSDRESTKTRAQGREERKKTRGEGEKRKRKRVHAVPSATIRPRMIQFREELVPFSAAAASPSIRSGKGVVASKSSLARGEKRQRILPSTPRPSGAAAFVSGNDAPAILRRGIPTAAIVPSSSPRVLAAKTHTQSPTTPSEKTGFEGYEVATTQGDVETFEQNSYRLFFGQR